MKKIIILLIIFLTGCNHSSKTSSNTPNIKVPSLTMGITLRMGYPFYMKNGSIEWMEGLNFLMDENLSNFDYENIEDFNKTSFIKTINFVKKRKYFTTWFNYSWFENNSPKNWYPLHSIQKAMNNGYIPVFIFYYFGDRFVTSPPPEKEIEKYYLDTQIFADFISELKGEKIVIIEPEFNKPYINNSKNGKKMAEVFSTAIDIIKEKNPNTKITLCMMDTGDRGVEEKLKKCGYENCSLGDKYEWSLADNVYKYLVDKLDYISFQEMVSQFYKKGDKLIKLTENDTGIDNLHLRINNFSKFLFKKYKKPVMLAYVAIASGTWNDKNKNGKIEENEFNPEGWNKKIYNFYYQMVKIKKELNKNGLFLYTPMALIDNPLHDKGGSQFFDRNEYHLGLINTGAEDEKDEALYGNLRFKASIKTP